MYKGSKQENGLLLMFPENKEPITGRKCSITGPRSTSGPLMLYVVHRVSCG